jgi:ATP-dependent Lon protease
MTCAGKTLPDNIRLWARRNLAVARSHEVTQEERRHAQRALSIMMNIQWKNNYFESIDPVEARRILDEELYGMEKVKQRIIETIIQINRTHTLPAYGLLLAGPAGTGKSQVAYAVARILKLPWTTLDMSSINDPEQLTGSSRIYSNAKPGIIMEAFSMAGESNLVFIINELDKASNGKGNGNPADVLLTLLDNLGFTDNYMECMIPTGGVYPIATANDKSRISLPLMSRFAVIDIPDYTIVEKKIIFQRFSLPKVLKRMGMKSEECIVEDDAVDVIIDKYKDQSGCRDLEQAAEHLAANALYRIETQHTDRVVFDAAMTEKVLEM